MHIATKLGYDKSNSRNIYPYGFLVMFLDCILSVISFLSPYWIYSKSIHRNEPINMGLWTICFNNFKFYKAPIKYYLDGCEWLYSNDVKLMRNLFLPIWLIVVQVLIFICFLLTFVILFAIIISLFFTRLKKKFQFIYSIIMLLCLREFLLILSLLIFGVHASYHEWTPNNVLSLSWSFWCQFIALGLSFLTSILYICCDLFYFNLNIIFQ